jgi:hypothetical protein
LLIKVFSGSEDNFSFFIAAAISMAAKTASDKDENFRRSL